MNNVPETPVSSDPVSKAGQPMEPAMALALAANFGSVDRWREQFIAMARSLEGLALERLDTVLERWTAAYPGPAGAPA